MLPSTESDEEEAPPLDLHPTLYLLYQGEAGILTPPRLLPVPPGATMLGRDSPLGLDDAKLSRHHALLQRKPGQATVDLSDQGSKNGTFVNGRRLLRAQLKDGDLIRLGNTLLLLRYLPAPPPQEDFAPSDGLLGASPAVGSLRQALRQLGPTPATILLCGETGTGKELCAQALHRHSGLPGPLVSVNCSAIPEALAESQLFGHQAGAFTGASAQPGLFRAARKGTLFLDEIADLPWAIQPKLLRALEERAVLPVGAVTPVPCEVRLIAAASKDLREGVHGSRFRGDLYARLAEVVLHLPPLRERREDVLLIFAQAAGLAAPPLAAPLAEALVLYHWPLNVRELCKLATDLRLRVPDAPQWTLAHLDGRLPGRPEEAAAEAQEAPAAPDVPPAQELERLLREHSGSISAVARAVGYSRKQVYRWLAHHGLSAQHYR